MSELIDAAIARMTDECNEKEYLIPLEEHMTNICTTDAIAKKILDPEKNLTKFFAELRNVAKGRAKDGCAYIPESEAFELLEKYYEISSADRQEPTKEEVVDIFDFL